MTRAIKDFIVIGDGATPSPPPSPSAIPPPSPPPSAPATPPPTSSPPPQGKGVIIFAYFGMPGSENDAPWSDIFAAKQQYPSVNMIVVVNPMSGFDPDDPAQVEQVTKIRDACNQRNIRCVGYVPAGFAEAPNRIDEIEGMAAAYDELQLDGVFLDETSGCDNCGDVYSQIASYCRSLGMTFVVGNPGSACPPDQPSFDIVCGWESAERPSAEDVCACTTLPEQKRAVIPHSVISGFNGNAISAIIDCCQYYYEIQTSAAWDDPATFVPWFLQICEIINSKNL